jgi:hypothetical protein
MSDTTTVPQGIDPSAQAEAAAKALAESNAKAAAAKAASEAAAARATEDPDLVRMTPKALKERIDEERAKGAKAASEALAAELGIPVADAKKLIADARAKEDAQKSEVQKLTEANAAKDAKLARLASLEEAVNGRAGIEFAGLTAEQQKAVQEIAGEDPAARLRTIDALKPTWAKVAFDAAAQSKAAEEAKLAAEAVPRAAAAPGKIPAPATTTPGAPPPPVINPGPPTNHLAVYESLKTTNPAMAARYHTAHASAIIAAQKKATG